MTTLNQLQTKPIMEKSENNDHDYIRAVEIIKAANTNLEIMFNQYLRGEFDITSKEEKENIGAYIRSILAATALLSTANDIKLEDAYTKERYPTAVNKKNC